MTLNMGSFLLPLGCEGWCLLAQGLERTVTTDLEGHKQSVMKTRRLEEDRRGGGGREKAGG